MNDSFDRLAEDLRLTLCEMDPLEQFWLGIVGAPGSGKTTLSHELVDRIGDHAMIVPMDGYHLYRAELNAMPDPTEANRRRGAPFTFNASKFVKDLTLARQSGSGVFPSFRHGVGDPIENDIQLDVKKHRLVIVEGNYLLLDDEPWCQLRSLFNQTWYLEVDTVVVRRRLIERFVTNGMSETGAEQRVETNDLLNAGLIRQQSPSKANRIVNLIKPT